jgi:hypothetical protein
MLQGESGGRQTEKEEATGGELGLLAQADE